jgi:hypothetical protein
MADALALGEKLISLLGESARVTTYKPALLLALIDCAQAEPAGSDRIAVSLLAEGVIELYWPQTLPYPGTGTILRQAQSGNATILLHIGALRADLGITARALPQTIRTGRRWEGLLTRVEQTLAQLPIPRLQRPFAPFLYGFDWPWKDAGAQT